MIISDLIAALEKAKADHGDVVVGFFSSPGVMSFSGINGVEFYEDVEYWRGHPHENSPALVLWNEGA